MIKKTVKPVHRAKAKAKPAHKARRHLRPVTKPPLKPHGVLGAQATKHAAPTTRVASPALSGSDSSSSALRHALIILLFGLPALVLGAALVPPHAVPHRMALVWRNSRLNVGLLAASVLLVEALLYMLTS